MRLGRVAGERRWRLALLAVPLALAGVVTVLVLPPKQTADVTIPPADASPVQVVETYLRAIDVHDCDTARAMWVGPNAGYANDDCVSISRISQVRPEPTVMSDETSGTDGTASRVAVSYQVSYRPFRRQLPDGRELLFYDLSRSSALGAPWRIIDAGTGG
jgi:hypothetical protein